MNTNAATDEKQITDIWRKYLAGVEHHRVKNMYRRDERCWHFYNGDQWYGMSQGGQELPIENIIKPILKYKVGTVATNDTTIVFSAMTDNPVLLGICDELNQFGVQVWEQTRMDVLKWQIIKAAAITGDSYLYCYDARPDSEAVVSDRTPRTEVRVVDRSSVYLGDEQEQDIQAQPWIILAERRPVSQIRKWARQNGVAEEEIDKIVSDTKTDTKLNSSE